MRSRAGDHFEVEAKRFDLIYEEEKSLSQIVVDRLFRRVIRIRYEKFFERYPAGSVRTAIDVGCGSGRYAERLYSGGADVVVGIDEAPAMIALARERARTLSGQGVLEYVEGDFLATAFSKSFDLAVGIGYFDYMKNPQSHLEKMRGVLRGPGANLVASFPKKWTLRTPIRKLRLTLRACPVYFYTQRNVVTLLSGSGFRATEILNLSRDLLVFAVAT